VTLGELYPARAAAKVPGVEPVVEVSEARFCNLIHLRYGMAWARGLLAAAGLSRPAAIAAHLGAGSFIDLSTHSLYEDNEPTLR
jgi:hypothetical protein